MRMPFPYLTPAPPFPPKLLRNNPAALPAQGGPSHGLTSAAFPRRYLERGSLLIATPVTVPGCLLSPRSPELPRECLFRQKPFESFEPPVCRSHERQLDSRAPKPHPLPRIPPGAAIKPLRAMRPRGWEPGEAPEGRQRAAAAPPGGSVPH